MEYLVSQNKPFAVNDIIQNLHNKVGKAMTMKALENLTKDARITTKTFGKVVIYACNEKQFEFPDDLDSNLFTFDKIVQLRSEFMELERERNSLFEKWNNLSKEPPNHQLVANIENRKLDLERLKSTLTILRDNWNPADEKTTQDLISSKLELEKEITKRIKIMNSLKDVIKDSVNPKNINEFLVCFNVHTHLRFFQNYDWY
ncbi:hypothetical protein NCAS_0A01810 [Naumovozyma castellii]|uniref:Homologous-pairing protein 2 winged helix domain-containing protein n=1 Tax=Naumovozyma castellii TaxID=27288 RepID=G0V5K2_NAUCA|nr:hypothetical protein NCAS_0A01810 [Naumovozyma castellii CBS 4309]CCC66739.1 hypothetical protein NCAS_0A01810 [Naumovozyma castellii CBS 4309]